MLFLQAVERLKEREARHAEVLESAVRRMQAVVAQAPDLAPEIEALAAAARERRAALASDDAEPTPLYVPAPSEERPGLN